jgi:hypothetical protein
VGVADRSNCQNIFEFLFLFELLVFTAPIRKEEREGRNRKEREKEDKFIKIEKSDKILKF